MRGETTEEGKSRGKEIEREERMEKGERRDWATEGEKKKEETGGQERGKGDYWVVAGKMSDREADYGYLYSEVKAASTAGATGQDRLNRVMVWPTNTENGQSQKMGIEMGKERVWPGLVGWRAGR